MVSNGVADPPEPQFVAGLALNFLSLRGVFGRFDDAVFGLILIAVMLFAEDGKLLLRGGLAAWTAATEGKASSRRR